MPTASEYDPCSSRLVTGDGRGYDSWSWFDAPQRLSGLVPQWAERLFTSPSRVAAALETSGALAALSVLASRGWSTPKFVVLVALACFALAAAACRLAFAEKLPAWTLHVDVALGNLAISVACAALGAGGAELAHVYLLVAMLAALYLAPLAALAHIGVAGVAYAAVLATGPHLQEPLAIAWLSVFGTASIASATVSGLVSLLRAYATADPLTSLVNRRVWAKRLADEMSRASRNGSELSVLVADLDGFKTANDELGHDAGDRLLCDLASSWRSLLRGAGDLLGRLGGDEFGLIVPGAGEVQSRQIAKRLAEACPEGTSVSIGIATWDKAEPPSHLLRRADQAMYRAKRLRYAPGAELGA
jgi:diguanylate cyclase (GGDEF)-like protein